jgi:hypothetical protein
LLISTGNNGETGKIIFHSGTKVCGPNDEIWKIGTFTDWRMCQIGAFCGAPLRAAFDLPVGVAVAPECA